MSQADVPTSVGIIPPASNDEVFSQGTRLQALQIVENARGSLIRSIMGPAKNLVALFGYDIGAGRDWSSVVEAKAKIRAIAEAANDSHIPRSKTGTNG